MTLNEMKVLIEKLIGEHGADVKLKYFNEDYALSDFEVDFNITHMDEKNKLSNDGEKVLTSFNFK